MNESSEAIPFSEESDARAGFQRGLEEPGQPGLQHGRYRRLTGGTRAEREALLRWFSNSYRAGLHRQL